MNKERKNLNAAKLTLQNKHVATKIVLQ